MCGIAGFTTFVQRGQDADAVLRRMTETLRHRGPDGDGYFRDASVALGHRRLAIIDVAGGAQPMRDESGRYTISFNGEIYNYIELRRELEQHGCRFRTQSDTEVLLQCLITHGAPGLARLDGMFAFALWDRKNQQLLLARDRIGIKPLYWFRCGADLVFASELKALLQHPLASRTLDLLSISKFFSYGYVPAPRTVFAGIQKLEAGAWLKFGAEGEKHGFFSDVPLTDQPVGPGRLDECCEELRHLLNNAVRRQLRSDVPVGVFLSGGIDSSAITALAAQNASKRLQSFSVAFDEPSYDESRYARRVAAMFGTEHHEAVFTLRRAAELFPRVMESFDEPFADASALPMSLLCLEAAREVKVVLGGDGGDELFAGYPSFQAHKIVEKLSFLPVGWRDWLGHMVRGLPVSHQYTSVEYLMQQLLKGLGLPPEMRFLLWMGCYGNEQKRQLFSATAREQLVAADPFEDVARYIRRSGLVGGLERLQYLCLKLYFQEDILTKVDRCSMAHSLEVRVPFMDNDLVNYACRIQSFNKLRGLKTKFILKRALHGLLPKEIIHRRKAGFMMPVARWLNGEMRETVRDLCSPQAIAQTGLFDASFVQTILDEHLQGRRDHRKHIYPLLCFMAWLRNYGSR